MMKRLWAFAVSMLLASSACAGDYYDHGSFPATNSSATSASMRAELDLIAAGFAKFPTFSGNGSKPLILNSGATGYTFTTGTLTLAGNFAISGAYATTLTATGATNVTLPTTGTLATLAGSESLSNKTIASPILSGSVTGTYSLAGSPTIASPTLSGTATGTYTLAGTPTITAPAITNPAISGGGALSGTFTGFGPGYTLQAPTISGPSLSGTVTGIYTLTGTYTLAGTSTISSPVINTGTVGADPTAALGIASKQYVDASSGARNPLINANMEIWQRGTTFAAASGYSADRWRYTTLSTSGVVTINRSTNVPSVAQAGVLFNYSLEADVTTADATMGAGEFAVLKQRIEGYNWRHFAQRQFTVSFWVMSSKTGVHCVAFTNSVSDRSEVVEYTIASADTWEYHTATFAASPSAGTWDYTNGIGGELDFTLMSGPGYQTTAGSWQVGNFYGTSSQVNVLDNTANFFRVTGVTMGLGANASQIIFIPLEEELSRCKRYYQKSFPYATAPAQNATVTGSEWWVSPYTGTTAVSVLVNLPVQLRTTSYTVTTYNPSAANAQARNATDVADDSGATISNTTERGFVFTNAPNATNSLGDQHNVHWTADSEL